LNTEMLKASQQALLQQTNVGLLNLRNIELNYYTMFYGSFNTQAALICGFVYSSVTQMSYGGSVPYSCPITLEYGPEVGNILYMCFWLTSTITVLASLHTIFCSTLILAFGPGKALFGPIGSMKPATDGMRDEMQGIIISYVVMVGSFAWSLIFSFWVVYELNAAIACSCMVVMSSYYWYVCSERIYNRFYYDGMWDSKLLKDDRTFDPRQEDQDDPIRQLDLEGIKRLEMTSTKGRGGKDTIPSPAGAATPTATATKSSFPVLARLPALLSASKMTTRPTSPSTASSTSRPSIASSTITLTSQLMMRRNVPMEQKRIIMQGVLNKKAGPHPGLFGFSIDDWKSRYFILTSNGELWYYKTKRSFLENPDKRLKERPVELSLYEVCSSLQGSSNNKDADDDVESSSGLSDVESINSSVSMASSSSAFSASSPIHKSPPTISKWRGGGSGGGGANGGKQKLNVYLVPNETMFSIVAPTIELSSQRVWHFRVDDEKEHSDWLAAFESVSASSLRGFQPGARL